MCKAAAWGWGKEGGVAARLPPQATGLMAALRLQLPCAVAKGRGRAAAMCDHVGPPLPRLPLAFCRDFAAAIGLQFHVPEDMFGWGGAAAAPVRAPGLLPHAAAAAGATGRSPRGSAAAARRLHTSSTHAALPLLSPFVCCLIAVRPISRRSQTWGSPAARTPPWPRPFASWRTSSRVRRSGLPAPWQQGPRQGAVS